MTIRFTVCHGWFHLHGLIRTARNAKQELQNEKFLSTVGFEQGTFRLRSRHRSRSSFKISIECIIIQSYIYSILNPYFIWWYCDISINHSSISVMLILRPNDPSHFPRLLEWQRGRDADTHTMKKTKMRPYRAEPCEIVRRIRLMGVRISRKFLLLLNIKGFILGLWQIGGCSKSGEIIIAWEIRRKWEHIETRQKRPTATAFKRAANYFSK